MKTEFALLAAFGDSLIPVADICEPLFGVKKQTAYQKIKAYTFPIPAFRISESNKNDYFVIAEDLAAYMDDQLDEPRDLLGLWIAYFCFILPNFAYLDGGHCEAEKAQLTSSNTQ